MSDSMFPEDSWTNSRARRGEGETGGGEEKEFPNSLVYLYGFANIVITVQKCLVTYDYY